jgi:hypothetical protein
MTIAWMIYVLLVGGLLSVSAWCIEDALRSAKCPTRWVWAAALFGTIAFAAFALRGFVAPASTLTLTNATVSTAASGLAPTSSGMLGMIDALRATASATLAAFIGAVSLRIPNTLIRLALMCWAAASALLLLMHLAVSRRVVRERRAWPLAMLPGGVARVAPALGPAVVGLTSPEIVVPAWLLQKTGEEQRLVMVHEQEHIAARDQFLPFGALLVATLLPWHPAVWWASARLRLAVELDCDARVLRRGEPARSYAALLIDIAAQCGGHRVGAVALADRTSHLERRILAMTPHASRFTRVRTIVLAAVAALATVTACEARLPTSSEVQAMDVASAEKAMVQAKLLDEKNASVEYVVDGKHVSAASAHAIAAKQIATVNVMKALAATPADSSRLKTMVRITTIGAASAVQDSGSVMTMSGLRSLDSSGAMSGQHLKVSYSSGTSFTADSATVTRADNGAKSRIFNGLLLVDGVQVSASQLAALKPDAIESVEVIKGAAAAKLSSDPAAANGIIRVTMKKQ